MNLRKIKYIGLLSIGLGLSSCNSVLDITPPDRVTDVLMWQNQDMVLVYTANFYSKLSSGFSLPHYSASVFTGNLLSNLTDDAEVNGAVFNAYWLGNYDASNSPLNGMWTSDRWTFIRRANEFIQKVDQVPGNQELNQRMKAEIRFLRAYYYYDMMQWFGPLPIITTAQESIGEEAFVARASLTAFQDFLIQEFQEVAKVLPKSYAASDWGRITKGAALVYKARVEMIAERWADAAATSQDIMDLGIYNLPADYAAVFSGKNKMNAEVILSVQHNENSSERGHMFDSNNQPPAFGGRGATLPTQNLVDAYQMQATGLPISDPNSGYDPNNPYAGRDPRFAATVLYDGASFRGRAMQLYNGGLDLTLSGGMISGWVSNTGYYLKKFTDESIQFADANVRSSQNWILARYAEVLLNYAEAQNESAGPDATVYETINKVRSRAQMPNLRAGLSKDEMREVIRQERRIELAFEDFRFHDVKRWKLATQLFSTTTNPIKKMEIVRNPTTNVKTYTVKNIAKQRIFLNKHYLYPIPLTEMIKPGNKLTQNPGWE